jgi:hypothetical protein
MQVDLISRSRLMPRILSPLTVISVTLYNHNTTDILVLQYRYQISTLNRFRV